MTAKKVKKVRYYIFLKDVLILAVSAFGGPQAHIALFFERLCSKRAYITEEELIELNALCSILPGPTSTQTITAIGYKIGRAKLAYLTLLVWVIPAGSVMILLGIMMAYIEVNQGSLAFTRFIKPMAVAIIAFAAYKISSKVISTKTGLTLMVISALLAYIIVYFWGTHIISAMAFPLMLCIGGLITSLKFNQHPKMDSREKLNIDWKNFFLYIGVFVAALVIGNITSIIYIKLFENFYRNGSMIFGGGQVLIPLLQAEFVDYKSYLSDDQFLSGLGFVQAMPGPVFSLCGYIGSLSAEQYGPIGQVLGGLVALAGVFLPGTFLIFFVYNFWQGLKKYRIIRASLEGINAVGSGLVAAAAVILFGKLGIQYESTADYIDVAVVGVTFMIMLWGKIPTPIIIFSGIVAGLIF